MPGALETRHRAFFSFLYVAIAWELVPRRSLDRSAIGLLLKHDNSVGICSGFVVFNPPAMGCFGEILLAAYALHMSLIRAFEVVNHQTVFLAWLFS
jgi:hypothetical protein